MTTRSVRLDAEAEAALQEIMAETGASLSAVLKRGLLALRDQQQRRKRTPWEVYRELGVGDRDAEREASDSKAASSSRRKTTRPTARESGTAVRELLTQKHRRQR